jgi:prepilin-type N-terminal cleavage/methylation domain-containing protein
MNNEHLDWGLRIGDFGNNTRNSKLRTPNLKGFTLIEVILVMMVIAILAAVAMPRLDIAITTSKASVEGAAHMIASDIRYAQEFAMANRVSKSVTFNSGSSIYTFNPQSTFDPSGRLPSGVTISTSFTVTFNSLGEPIAGGGSSVTVSDGVNTRTITVTQYTGKVNIS